jgi:hypothetical protein
MSRRQRLKMVPRNWQWQHVRRMRRASRQFKARRQAKPPLWAYLSLDIRVRNRDLRLRNINSGIAND